MCYHYEQKKKPKEVEHYYDSTIEEPEKYEPHYHVNAFQFRHMSVKVDDSIRMFTWGLIPFWVKDQKSANDIRSKTLNAMSETAFEKPSFRAAIRERRCLIPATGFFEWMHHQGKKYPYRIFLKDRDLFSFGGIYETWRDKESGKTLSTFSILTTEANPLMEKIHNSKKRMPLILPREVENKWLDPDLKPEEIKDLMLPSFEAMDAYSISSRITSRTENTDSEETGRPFKYPELN